MPPKKPTKRSAPDSSVSIDAKSNSDDLTAEHFRLYSSISIMKSLYQTLDGMVEAGDIPQDTAEFIKRDALQVFTNMF